MIRQRGRGPMGRASIPAVRRALLLTLAALHLAVRVWAQAPVAYRLSFPEPEHHWMQVEASFTGLPQAPLEVCMSRSSPGRYAIHEFAKNVFDVRAADGQGRPIELVQAAPERWNVGTHDGTVRITYKVFGDRVDGTFLSVDVTHAHINMPAALMWARGLEDRSALVTLEEPAGRRWRAATQLHPTDDELTFTASNLSYLMDSPIEFGDFALRSFTAQVPGAPAGTAGRFRVALHGADSDADADRFVADLQRIAREEAAVFGEFPAYEGGTYTFLADILPQADRDGMEHRNSTVITGSGSLRDEARREDLLDTAAHELFHGWNIERIRPRSLEPFDLERANMSGELWLGEGFTSYYDALVMTRTGLASLAELADTCGSILDAVIRSPARRFRSVQEMSRLAPFVDAAAWIDRTNWNNTFISYYTWGAAIGLALDLSLRERSHGAVTLDHYMRAMWQAHGRPQGPAEGAVPAPYTNEDARDVLAEVSGDRAFAREFFSRFIEGREVADYTRLLAQAGLLLRRRNPGRAWLGDVRVDFSQGTARIVSPTTLGTPIYAAGLDLDDEVVALDGERLVSPDRLDRVLRGHRPGDRLQATIRRRGLQQDTSLVLEEDPRLEIVPVEGTGRQLTPAERAFRSAWLDSRQ
jgi:predicted metalloprotease with PDZ domain